MSFTPVLALTTPTAAKIAGVTVIARIRRLLVVAVISAALYPAFMGGSKGYCPGGVDGDGGFVDANGVAVEQAPECISLALAPSPAVYVALVAIVLVAISRVLKAASDDAAMRTIDRAAFWIGMLVAVAIVDSQLWFASIAITEIDTASFTVFSPFPFGTIEVTTGPMTTQ